MSTGRTLLITALVIVAMGPMSSVLEKLRPAPPPPPSPRTPEQMLHDRQVGAASVAVKVLRESMHDPESFKLVEVLLMRNGAACYTFRAKNGFGALRVGYAVFDGSRLAAYPDDSGAYDRLSHKHCSGKKGEVITDDVKWHLARLS